jgi:peptidyl-prolyl cis-trans isomerase SurA
MKNLFLALALAITCPVFVSSCNKHVSVSAKEVDDELDHRIDYFAGIFGSREKVEEYYGKSIKQLKNDFRADVEKQLLDEKMKQKN